VRGRTKGRSLARGALFAIGLVLAPSFTILSAAEANTGSPAAHRRTRVRGRVIDANGAAVPGARVDALREGSSTLAAATVSDSGGKFALALEEGAYVVRVAVDRSAETARSLRVPASGPDIEDVVLQVTAVREAITVTAPNGYTIPSSSSATKTITPLRDVPQAVTVVTRQLMQDQLMTSIGDVVRYIPGISLHQGENNRDQIIVRGNSSSADFFVDGVRDDVQYYRDLYNLDHVEALKGPNALIFGRGGAGGVVNRVTKEAGFAALREIDVQGGAYGDRRAAVDFDQPLGEKVAFRLNGVYENSGSFRRDVDLERYGVAPTLTFQPGDATKVTVGYEYFRDRRVADRGISSFQGRPAGVDIATYYGNPNDSHVRADVGLASALIEHREGALTVRNRSLFGDYDRGYQNYVPGAVSANGATVALTAYNNATKRQNLFNQTDITYEFGTGSIRHTVLAGAEVGRQLTDNFRNTGFFNDSSTSILVPFANPLTSIPVIFRQSATDADNRIHTNLAAAYVQEQAELSAHVQLVAGIRYDLFDLDYKNNRNGDDIGRIDHLLSPRAGIVVKPVEPLSLYGSYSVSYLPSSGDQFSSLTTITQQLEPERFDNYEVGAKWDAGRGLSMSAAVYRLDRTNTRSTDPNDPTRIVQTGSQRTNGFELGANGQITEAWSVAGGYSWQDAFVTSATAAARAGAQAAQVPHHTLSLWNLWQVHPRVAAGLGIVARSAMFATIDDTVTLPGYARIDAAAYVSITKDVRVQVNVENLLGKTYYANADSNTNISPGSPRAIRLGSVARF
jgi:catecholate siderophore receptor